MSVEPIAADVARARIQSTIEEHLGADWNDEDTGWIVVYDSDFLVRLTRGKVNLDFQSDLLGEISITEREINPVQGSGRLLAWMILGVSLLLALVLARLAGVIN